MITDEVQELHPLADALIPLASWELTCHVCHLAYNRHLPSCTNCQAVDKTTPTWFNARKEMIHGVR